MATKKNPGAFDCYGKMSDEEPHFVLRGKDPTGSFLVRAWRALRAGDIELAVSLMFAAQQALKESGRTLLPYDAPKSLEAFACSKDMLAWYASLDDQKREESKCQSK